MDERLTFAGERTGALTRAASALYEYQQSLDVGPASWWTEEECREAIEVALRHLAMSTELV